MEELKNVIEKEKSELDTKVTTLTKEKDEADDELYELQGTKEKLEREIAVVSLSYTE